LPKGKQLPDLCRFVVKHYPDELVELVQSFRPNVEDFRNFKAKIAATFCPPIEQSQIVELALGILAVQFMFWSGWGWWGCAAAALST
jgi:hypothetical protein